METFYDAITVERPWGSWQKNSSAMIFPIYWADTWILKCRVSPRCTFGKLDACRIYREKAQNRAEKYSLYFHVRGWPGSFESGHAGSGSIEGQVEVFGLKQALILLAHWSSEWDKGFDKNSAFYLSPKREAYP